MKNIRSKCLQYLFNEKEEQCLKQGRNKPLELINKYSFQWTFKENSRTLTIEKLSDKIITATLKNVSEKHTQIANWDDKDYGRAVWDEEKGDYVLKYGLPKLFYLFNNKYDGENWNFNFDHNQHLILKDKDTRKPYYWYYFDYSPTLSNFIYYTLSEYILPADGQIVAIPAELGEGVEPWREDYFVNASYCGFDPKYEGYDLYTDTYEEWMKREVHQPALIISFLPTYFKNYELERGEKTTGTTWFKQLWRMFGERGVPMVVKVYKGFVYMLLYRIYREIYDQISSITELPTAIDGREVGKSNLLVYFNCPWMEEKTPWKE